MSVQNRSKKNIGRKAAVLTLDAVGYALPLKFCVDLYPRFPAIPKTEEVEKIDV